MNRIVDLILKVFGLLEAEGRAFKHCAIELLTVACFWAAATGLALAGVAVVSASLYFALTWIMPNPLAGAIVGIVLCALAVRIWSCGEQCLKEPSDAEKPA